MEKTDKRKQSLYFTDAALLEIRAEAERLDRSLSWVIQRAWRIARERIRAMGDEGNGEDHSGSAR